MKHFIALILLASVLCADLSAKTSQHRTAGKTHSIVSLPADKALKKLMEGNRRFAAHRMRHPDESIRRRIDLARNGQHPFAIILSCSDSRVPPEIVFDEGLGDLFVIRIAGNIADDAVIGSIEYAAEHLGVSLLMVLGHENCGAVKAAISNEREAHLASMVDAIHPVVEKVLERENSSAAHFNEHVVQENVTHVARLLRTNQPVLAKLVDENKLRIVGGYYQLATGQVKILSK